MAVVVIGVLLVMGKMQWAKLATNTNPAPQPTPTASPEPVSTSASSDAVITTEIQRAIAATEWAKEASINVGVKDGNVTLTGKAPRHYDADMAGAIAANISGVKLVHNEIAVPTPTPAPTQVAQIPTKPTKPDNSQQKKQEAALKQRVDQLIQTGVFQRENRQFGGAMQSFRDALKLDPGNQQAVTEIKNTVKAAGLAGNLAGQPQQNQNVPLKFWQVRAMLEAKMVPQKIVGAVRLRGVDFGLTTDQEQTLRDAGANDGLIRVIHNNRR